MASQKASICRPISASISSRGARPPRTALASVATGGNSPDGASSGHRAQRRADSEGHVQSEVGCRPRRRPVARRARPVWQAGHGGSGRDPAGGSRLQQAAAHRLAHAEIVGAQCELNNRHRSGPSPAAQGRVPFLRILPPAPSCQEIRRMRRRGRTGLSTGGDSCCRQRKRRRKLTVVVPVFNEAENSPELVRRVAATLERCVASFEIIFVDDGSSDGTLAAAGELRERRSAHRRAVVQPQLRQGNRDRRGP